MEVFLIPVGRDRYQLYCEVPDEPAEVDDHHAAVRGRRERLKRWFRHVLLEAEREGRRSPDEGQEPGSDKRWHQRVKRSALRRVAEAIAEQRLLWHMRRQSQATAVFPADITPGEALVIVNDHMQHDFERHRYWLVVDTILFVLSGALAIIPGPNVVAYYFAFRMVGHYLSMRGARQALKRVQWETRPSPPLAELRYAIDLEPSVREARVTDIAAELRLERLATFFNRTAVPSA
jgi:hypothetical protein